MRSHPNFGTYRSVRLDRFRRWSLYGLLIVLLLSGAVWLLLHDGSAEATPSAIEPWMMRLHGAAAMLVIFMTGTMLFGHVLNAWNRGRNRYSGGFTAGIFLLLAVSGYGLYYFGGEGLRRVTEYLHWVLGFGAPLALWWHVSRGRRRARR